MADLIHLLSDAVANQIAAGEVVQRPASVVKELLENTIDAGATDIKLVIRDAGKLLIQVIDNGCGMSQGDARMCFERHATSKIRKADDLLAIQTLGFRGEALASIASVAQVELKTRKHGDELGTMVLVEGTEFKGQSAVSCPAGTSVSVKNLFFNVPARRNFLKANTLELKYILDEFFRISLVNPGISFTAYNQDKILYQLPSGHLKERILNLYGAAYAQRLVPVKMDTPMVNISGFIGKPEFAKRTRGEQFFFTNRRFMKNAYFHHAVELAFKELIPSDAVPTYFLFLEVDPGTIDVNIHPTKTEINFQDNKSIYALLHAAVKQAIGKFNITPSLDFEREQGLDIPPPPTDRPVMPPTVTINPDYNPFNTGRPGQTAHPLGFPTGDTSSIRAWRDFYADLPATQDDHAQPATLPFADTLPQTENISASTDFPRKINLQVNQALLITHTKSGVVIIDQQRAHERILYERMMKDEDREQPNFQSLLIPSAISLNTDDAGLLRNWLGDFLEMGFEISDFGKNSFLIHTIPAGTNAEEAGHLIESVLEAMKNGTGDHQAAHRSHLSAILASKLAVKRGKKLHPAEIDSIIESLFACHVPDLSPDGRPTMMLIPYEEIHKKLKIN